MRAPRAANAMATHMKVVGGILSKKVVSKFWKAGFEEDKTFKYDTGSSVGAFLDRAQCGQHWHNHVQERAEEEEYGIARGWEID